MLKPFFSCNRWNTIILESASIRVTDEVTITALKAQPQSQQGHVVPQTNNAQPLDAPGGGAQPRQQQMFVQVRNDIARTSRQ